MSSQLSEMRPVTTVYSAPEVPAAKLLTAGEKDTSPLVDPRITTLGGTVGRKYIFLSDAHGHTIKRYMGGGHDAHLGGVDV